MCRLTWQSALRLSQLVINIWKGTINLYEVPLFADIIIESFAIVIFSLFLRSMHKAIRHQPFLKITRILYETNADRVIQPSALPSNTELEILWQHFSWALLKTVRTLCYIPMTPLLTYVTTTWISNYINYNVLDEIIIPSLTSTVAPLKFMYGLVTSFHNFLGM